MTSFGKDVTYNAMAAAEPSVLGRAVAIQAVVDTLMPRDTTRDLCVISLRAGSLDTTIQEVFDDIAEWLRRILVRADMLLPGRSRTAFYKEVGALALPPLSRGLIGLAGVTLEASLQSMRATDITTDK